MKCEWREPYPQNNRRHFGRSGLWLAQLGAWALLATVTSGYSLSPHAVALQKLADDAFAINGLPPIVNPKFIKAKDALLPGPTDPVIGVVINGQAKAYPLSLLIWNEVADDTVGGKPIAATLCPLTNTAVVYDREVNGKPATFSASSKIYESNRLLVDSATHSLWCQIDGKAIIGPATGHALTSIPSTVTMWRNWKQLHPDTLVVEIDPESNPRYGQDPYMLYEHDQRLLFPLDYKDSRLAYKQVVVGVEFDHQAVAFPLPRLELATLPLKTTVGGKQLTINYDERSNTIGVLVDGKSAVVFTGYWFAWAEMHPHTAIWGKPVPDETAVVFKDTGSMTQAREGASATLLPDGRVLVAGGSMKDTPAMLNTAELYNPKTATFSRTGDLQVARGGQVATLLKDGKVLLTGGMTSHGVSNAAEVYDPASGQFQRVGDLNVARSRHTATLLADGKVLVVGGIGAAGHGLSSAELYDPATRRFVLTAPLAVSRHDHCATLMPDGEVLITGGTQDRQGLLSAELYNPHTERFSPAPDMLYARSDHTATLLPNGKVLLTGGLDRGMDGVQYSAELYDLKGGKSTEVAQGMFIRRSQHRAVLLNDGDVLIVGGVNQLPIASAELYDTSTGRFVRIGRMHVPRYGPSVTLLKNGEVLVTGRYSMPGFPPTSEVELYQEPKNESAKLTEVSR